MSALRESATLAVLGLISVVCVPARARAQGWQLEALAGRMRYESAPALDATSSLAVGIRWLDADSWFRASAGIPLGDGQPVWGGGAISRRLAWRRGSLSMGADFGANGIVYRFQAEPEAGLGLLPVPEPEPTTRTGFAIAGEILPVVSYGGLRSRVEARAGAAHYHGELDSASTDRTVTSADARLTVAPAMNVALSAVVRGFRAEDGNHVYGGLTSSMVHGRATFWGSAGQWLGGEIRGTPWAAGIALRATDRLSLVASGRRDTFDPLYRVPTQTSWSVGAAIALSPINRPKAPIPAAYVDGRATIVLPGADARGDNPRIAGDFNGWKPAPMSREGSRWIYRVPVAPGVYHYAFITQNGEWFVPESVPGRKDDGMGGEVAVLIVR